MQKQWQDIIIINLTPIVGWMILDWNLFEIISIYWLELAMVFLAAIFNMIVRGHPNGILYFFAIIPISIIMIMEYAFIGAIFGSIHHGLAKGEFLPEFFRHKEILYVMVALMGSFLYRHRKQLKTKRGEMILGEALHHLAIGLALLPLILLPIVFIGYMLGLHNLGQFSYVLLFLIIKIIYDYVAVYSKVNFKTLFRRKKK